jgi:hypothetical protein
MARIAASRSFSSDWGMVLTCNSVYNGCSGSVHQVYTVPKLFAGVQDVYGRRRATSVAMAGVKHRDDSGNPIALVGASVRSKSLSEGRPGERSEERSPGLSKLPAVSALVPTNPEDGNGPRTSSESYWPVQLRPTSVGAAEFNSRCPHTSTSLAADR